MHINFRHVDESFYGKNEYIMPIVKEATKNEVFFTIVCEILNTYNQYTEHIVSDIKRAMKLAEYKVKSCNADMYLYKNLEACVENFYWNIIDDDFATKLKNDNEKLYRSKRLKYPDNRIARFRGLLFEELVAELVKKRFDNCLFDTGCQVYINHCRVIVNYGEGDARHKETIDVAGWERKAKYGEFYECKINPQRFNEEHFKYLIELNTQLQKNGAKQVIVGFVCSDTMQHVQTRKDFLSQTYDLQDDEILLIGRERIYAINNYVIPEIA